MDPRKPGLLNHLTYKGNLRDTRYGWLRLTPAYSIHLVSEVLDACTRDGLVVLDPFCGTGTTALVCAERGIASETTDINPFLIWLARTKAHSYLPSEIEAFRVGSAHVAAAMLADATDPCWIPTLHQIEKWWDSTTLVALARGMAAIWSLEDEIPCAASDLLKVTFCRTLIERGHVSFGHQSMSFKRNDSRANGADLLLNLEFSALEEVCSTWRQAAASIAHAAASRIRCEPAVRLCDARNLSQDLGVDRCTCVITSPPYPNRMSYIRELRPYMFWLGYLQGGREAGELDWQAIGGTWGCATSNLSRWGPDEGVIVPYVEFERLLEAIARTSTLLSAYVHKYFHDMVLHVRDLFRVVASGGTINYIVGNSKFYDAVIPVQEIYRSLFESVGFAQCTARVIRKRTSKKELYEYLISARKP